MNVYLTTAMWLSFAVAAYFAMVVYSNNAGRFADESPILPPQFFCQVNNQSHHSLFMFVHPKCPCTQASFSELARLHTDCRSQLEITLFFFQPTERPDSWSQASLWHRALRIPGADIVIDRDAKLAMHMAATTSGIVFLYSPQGKLLFRGGITSARGHEGNNIGRQAITAIVNQQPTTVSTSPVFGCPIIDPSLIVPVL